MPLRQEIRRTARLAFPVVGTQISTMLLGTVDTLMVGRVSIEALGAAALANAWFLGTTQFALGVLFGLDPIITQAHGAGRPRLVGLALQRGLVLAGLISVPLAGLWMGTEAFLLWAGQDAELSRTAFEYTRVQIPSIPFFLAYTVLRQYLQGRELVRPALWVILIANVLNVGFNWVLIFGNLGFPAMGLTGAGIATSLTRATAFAGLLLWVLRFGLHRGAWVPWSREALQPRGLLAVLRFGIPVGIQTSLEFWAFSAAALLAGWLGSEPLAAHIVALNMAALAFMVPLGISQAAVTRVGNLLGAGDRAGAQRAAWVALALGSGVMLISATVFVVFRHQLPRIYTPDAAVIALCSSILPIAAAFQIFDGAQVVGCGVLRGMGRTRPAAVFNAISYWALGLPLAWALGLRGGWGLAGIWWGLCFGLAVVAIFLTGWIYFRGPATVRDRAF